MPCLKNLAYYIAFAFLLLNASCASIVAPTGGPKDETAPKLLNKGGVDSVLNFKGGNIVIEFDEFIKLDNIQKNFSISPLTKRNPKIRVKKKTLIVELPDSLLENNTTYNLDFGSAVQDLREGNKYENLELTLSTGSYFDSLSLNGKVYDAKTGRGDSLLVLLYPMSTPDSMILKDRPMYITKARGGGFSFSGLPSKKFKMAALSDKNANYTYDAFGEKIAFTDQVIDTENPDSALVLYSFIEDRMIDTANGQALKRKGAAQGPFSYTFEPDIKRTKKIDSKDSLKIILSDNPGMINTDKIRFYENKVLDLSMTTSFDDSTGVITLFPHWEMGSDYMLVLKKAFIRDSLDKGSEADTLNFSTMAVEDYGSIIVTVDSSYYKEGAILQLYSKNKEIGRSTEIRTPKTFDFLKPQSYRLRILYDENGNGEWDSGNLKERKQAEITIALQKGIRLKPNWENKVEWNKEEKKKKMGAK